MSIVYVELRTDGGRLLSTCVTERGPPSFSKLNFSLSARICEQSKDKTDVIVERRTGIDKTENVAIRMIGSRRRENGCLNRDVDTTCQTNSPSELEQMSDRKWVWQ